MSLRLFHPVNMSLQWVKMSQRLFHRVKKSLRYFHPVKLSLRHFHPPCLKQNGRFQCRKFASVSGRITGKRTDNYQSCIYFSEREFGELCAQLWIFKIGSEMRIWRTFSSGLFGSLLPIFRSMLRARNCDNFTRWKCRSDNLPWLNYRCDILTRWNCRCDIFTQVKLSQRHFHPLWSYNNLISRTMYCLEGPTAPALVFIP